MERLSAPERTTLGGWLTGALLGGVGVFVARLTTLFFLGASGAQDVCVDPLRTWVLHFGSDAMGLFRGKDNRGTVIAFANNLPESFVVASSEQITRRTRKLVDNEVEAIREEATAKDTSSGETLAMPCN